MKRREFLKTAALAAAAFGTARSARSRALPHPLPTLRPGSPSAKNWTWIPLDPVCSTDDWKRLFALLRENGIQAILPEIYDGRYAHFASQRLPVKADLLNEILPLAHAEQLEVHAWMWSMPCMISEVLRKHPDWYNVNAQGDSTADKPPYVDYYKFLDPARPEVREWVQGTVKELAAIPGIAGVHLDYIRYPDAILPRGLWSKYKIVQDKVYPRYDYGYSSYARDAFKKMYGVDPIRVGGGELRDPSIEAAWLQFRLDSVVDMVNDYLVPAAHEKNKAITAAVFPGPSLARQMVRQDWGRFHIDAFFPMLYNVYYEESSEWVEKETNEAVSTVKQPVYSGLFVHDLKPKLLLDTMDFAFAGGASGVSLYSADGMDAAKWKAFHSSRAKLLSRD